MKHHCPAWRNSSVRARIAQICTASDITHTALADESGYENPTVRAVLKGYQSPSFAMLETMVAALGYRIKIVSEAEHRGKHRVKETSYA